MTTTFKSVHIKECWPFEYKAEEKYRFTPKNPRTKAQAASANNLAKAREAVERRKILQTYKTEGKSLLDLRVYELDIDFCEELNSGKA